MKKKPIVRESEEEDDPKDSCQLIPGGFAGTGTNSQTDAVAPPGWWIDLATGKFLFFSPNFVWLSIALADYFLFPYDFQAAKSFKKLDWVLIRFAVNFTITFGYTGFWHSVTYLLGWTDRPFHPSRQYKKSK